MAEIRSTLDMVLERAAKLCDSTESNNKTDSSQDGMRAAAAYLNDESFDLNSALQDIGLEAKASYVKGMVETFLRNLILPRDDDYNYDKVFLGIEALGDIFPGKDNLLFLLNEMKTLLPRYLEHRQQLRQQLEDNFAAQMGQLEANLAQQTGVSMELQPSQHPKFAEEWDNVTMSLNEQYGNALDQYKDAISKHLTTDNH